MRQRIAIVDYGMGNIHSIDKALRYVAPEDEVLTVQDPALIETADRVVFPGVGAIRDCMAALRSTKLDLAIQKAAQEKPCLAICVGMQALYGANEEDRATRGIGIIDGEVKRLAPKRKDLKVPHMGWNRVHYQPSPLWAGIEQDSRFYFVHSYYCAARDSSIRAAACRYDVEFDAAIRSAHVFAVQFHPEKSHQDGLRFLTNFINWRGAADQ